MVKFIDWYRERAHHLLADVGLALQLLYYGPPCVNQEDPSYCSLFMVVIEYIEGKTFATAKAQMDQKTTEQVQLEVNWAIQLLHDHSLVFGDLHPPNVMVTKKGGVQLIDFNWAGEKGQVKYPFLILMEIGWPSGVKALAHIEQVHDLKMLEQLFS
jgi:hypothetical protein